MNLLNSVVLKTEYTGPRVKIDGYQVGGKTGTSELINPKEVTIKIETTSFIGVFPIKSQNMLFILQLNILKKKQEQIKKWLVQE